MQHREERITKHIECPHLFGDDPDKDEEEVMAAICHNGETYKQTGKMMKNTNSYTSKGMELSQL